MLGSVAFNVSFVSVCLPFHGRIVLPILLCGVLFFSPLLESGR